jgi:hypothetical protein
VFGAFAIGARRVAFVAGGVRSRQIALDLVIWSQTKGRRKQLEEEIKLE